MIREALWRIVAYIVTRPRVTDWLIRRAQRTPYTHITSQDGSDIYMGRWWLFNPYLSSEAPKAWWGRWLPSIRIHHILRPDSDRHLHDHPWNARTIVLRGWYVEERPATTLGVGAYVYGLPRDMIRVRFERRAGYTGRLLFGQFHRISEVPVDGVLTLFITWRKRGTWGFLVDADKVPWREYLGVDA